MYSNKVTCKQILFGSNEHALSIELRREVLRKPLGLDFNQRDLDAEIDQFHLAAFINNQLVGILILKQMKDIGNTVLKMRQVAVNPDHQSMGVGRELVEFSEEWAKENGYDTIDLHARKNVLPFYLKMNYQVQGDEFLEVGIPHFKMIKSL